jgi:hypothetical protein
MIFFGGDGDEWDEETQAILHSESGGDENEQIKCTNVVVIFVYKIF